MPTETPSASPHPTPDVLRAECEATLSNPSLGGRAHLACQLTIDALDFCAHLRNNSSEGDFLWQDADLYEKRVCQQWRKSGL